MEQSALPVISCVCPTKNRKRFAAESIRRFLAQNYAGRAELVIVEDGAEAWAQEGTELHPCANREIRYFRFEGTLGAKLNYGAQQARGEIIANWDDDDFYTPDRLRRQFAHMQASGKPIVGLSSFLCYREGEAHGWEYHASTPAYCGGATQMYRRDWALAHPHPDVTQGEDAAYTDFAHACGDLSTMSGMDVLVVRDHSANTCPRDRGAFMLHGIRINHCDNWREVPLERIRAVLDR